MHKNYHCEFSNTMPFIVSSHSFPFLFSEIFSTVTLHRNFRTESPTWKENFQVFRLQRKRTAQTFNIRYLNGICVFIFSLMGTNNNNKESFYYRESWQMKTHVQFFHDGRRVILLTSFRIYTELKKLKMSNTEECNFLVLPNLGNFSFEDNYAAQTQIRQHTIYRNFPNIVPSISLFY